MNVVNQFKEIKFKDILLQVKEKKQCHCLMQARGPMTL